jgi:hypothetical protein
MIIELLEYILQVHNLFHVNVKRNRYLHPSPPIVYNGGSFTCVKPTEREATTCFNILLILKMHRDVSTPSIQIYSMENREGFTFSLSS